VRGGRGARVQAPTECGSMCYAKDMLHVDRYIHQLVWYYHQDQDLFVRQTRFSAGDVPGPAGRA
jgi:hypothetical protein